MGLVLPNRQGRYPPRELRFRTRVVGVEEIWQGF